MKDYVNVLSASMHYRNKFPSLIDFICQRISVNLLLRENPAYANIIASYIGEEHCTCQYEQMHSRSTRIPRVQYAVM